MVWVDDANTFINVFSTVPDVILIELPVVLVSVIVPVIPSLLNAKVPLSPAVAPVNDTEVTVSDKLK